MWYQFRNGKYNNFVYTMKDEIREFWCEDSGVGYYLFKPLNVIIGITFFHSGTVKTYENGLESRIQMQIYDPSNFNFPESLIEVKNEFHFTVIFDTPTKKGNVDYKVSYQILIDEEKRW